jgi:ribosomal protein S18 acetylase RimI-like enzyme
MPDILTDLSPSSLAVAIRANLYAFFQHLHHSSAAAVHETPDALRWHTTIAHPWFNGILSLHPPTDEITELAQRTIAYFQPRAVAGFTWWLAPLLEPATWLQHLQPLGFRYDNHTPGMAIDLAVLPPSPLDELTIQPVEDSPTLAKWASTFIQGYGIPESMTPPFLTLVESMGIDLPFRYYLGSLNSKPVAASTLFLGAGVAGIYNVATLPEARGRGIGAAMTLTPLYEARNMGFRAGVLQSSDMAYRVYERLGFQRLCQIDHFYWPG